jgi:hypothetical protein
LDHLGIQHGSHRAPLPFPEQICMPGTPDPNQVAKLPPIQQWQLSFGKPTGPAARLKQSGSIAPFSSHCNIKDGALNVGSPRGADGQQRLCLPGLSPPQRDIYQAHQLSLPRVITPASYHSHRYEPHKKQDPDNRPDSRSAPRHMIAPPSYTDCAGDYPSLMG